jgi:hypothetical protein
MEGDGDDERQNPDRHGIEGAVGGQKMILTGFNRWARLARDRPVGEPLPCRRRHPLLA